MADLIQIRRDVAVSWSMVNPKLAIGEVGIITDVEPKQCKIGDGVTYWNDLPVQSWAGSGSLSDLSASIAIVSSNLTTVSSSLGVVSGSLNIISQSISGTIDNNTSASNASLTAFSASISTDLSSSVNILSSSINVEFSGSYALIDTISGSFEANKADKVSGSVSGDFASLDSNGNLVDSGKKASDFQNTLVAGTNIKTINGESILGPGNIVISGSGGDVSGKADKVSGSVEGDLASLDSSGNLVDSGIPSDNVAQQDGYYELMTVGMAKNIEGQSSIEGTYLERMMGDNTDVASGIGSLESVESNAVAWNQLVPDASVHATGTATETSVNVGNSSSGLISVISGHKYFIMTTSGKSGTAILRDIPASISAESTMTNGCAVISVSGNGNKTYLTVSGFTVDEEYDFYVNIFDLTLMFVYSKEPTTVAEFKSWLAKNVGIKPYYPYNAGTLLGTQYEGLKALKTPNLLNPTTKTARLLEYTYGSATNKYTVSNLPTGSTLYFTPDNTGVEAAVTMDDATHFTVASQGTLRVDTNDSVANTWLIAYWDGSMDDYSNFKPYQENSVVIDSRYVYYVNDGVKTKVWADGVMKATGQEATDVKDRLYVDDNDGKWKADVNVLESNLGDFNYTKQGTLYTTQDFIPTNTNLISDRGTALKWNQFIQNGDFSNGTSGWNATGGATISVNNKVCTVTPLAKYGGLSSLSFGLTNNHKYCIIATVNSTDTSHIQLRNLSTGANYIDGIISNGMNIAIGTVTNYTATHTAIIRIIDYESSNWNTFTVQNVMLIDLTIACPELAADPNLTTAMVEAWLAANGLTEDYYAYDTGSLGIVNAGTYQDAAAFKTAMDGVHLWSESINPVTYDTLYYSEDGENFTEMNVENYPTNITVNNWATEEALVSPYDSSGNPTSAAPTVETLYGLDVAEWVDSANNGSFISATSMDNFLTILSAYTNKTWSKTWDPNTNAWTFSYA